MGSYKFPIYKRGIFYKFKSKIPKLFSGEIKTLGGDVQPYVAQLMSRIDAEIVKKNRL